MICFMGEDRDRTAHWLMPELEHVAPPLRNAIIEQAKARTGNYLGWFGVLMPFIGFGILAVSGQLAVFVHRTSWGSSFPRTMWFVLFAAAGIYGLIVLTALVIRRHILRELRIMLNLCRNCGYNLKGNESGTCPECGVPVSR